ncbi:MAG: PDGLE domain-containing protein, partial [Saprospiraceae bacterium]|nr:PDGLE domain-containing protein [Saprospiraceae bacterium]
SRPDLLGENSESANGSRGWVIAGALVTLLVVLLSPLASSDPDGLERVATDLGLLQLAGNAPYEILPDYTLPFLGSTPASTVIAGIIGILVVGVVIVLLGQGMKAKS